MERCASFELLDLCPVAAKATQNRASTGATDLVSSAPTLVRLSSGAPLPDGDLALYHLLEVSSPKPTSSASPLLQSTRNNRTQLAVKQSPQEQGLACVQHKKTELSGPMEECKIQPKQEQDADKENLLIEGHLSRFNMIEARQTTCLSSGFSLSRHVPDIT